VESPADFLTRWQYTGLFAVILVEEAGVPLPLPGDLFIAAMGFLAHAGRASYAPTAAVVTIATVLGAGILYLLARHAGRPLIVRVARRLGYTEEREVRLEAWLARRGAAAVVLGRLIPGLRIVMTVVAGALRLRQSTFALGTLVAGLLWATVYFWGRVTSASWTAARCRPSGPRRARSRSPAAPSSCGAHVPGAPRTSSPERATRTLTRGGVHGEARPARAAPRRGRTCLRDRRPRSVVASHPLLARPRFRRWTAPPSSAGSCSSRTIRGCVRPSGRCSSERASR
jgi:membrane protein DedA with SNARE-associated domain